MKAVVALGANIGNPQEQMDLAIAMLKEATEVTAISSYYLFMFNYWSWWSHRNRRNFYFHVSFH